jgi:hypothetical protein
MRSGERRVLSAMLDVVILEAYSKLDFDLHVLDLVFGSQFEDQDLLEYTAL